VERNEMTSIKSHYKVVKAFAVVTKRGRFCFVGTQRRATSAWLNGHERVVPCFVRYLVPVKAGKLK
jgi:hypothetical protein